MAGQKNDGCGRKRIWGVIAPDPAGSFSRPDLAIPRWVASQQSPTPFHQTTASIADPSHGLTSTRLRDFRLWMVLQDIVQPESHSRAPENYPQSRPAVQVLRLPRSAMGRSPQQNGHRDFDRTAGERPCDLFGLRPAGAG